MLNCDLVGMDVEGQIDNIKPNTSCGLLLLNISSVAAIG